MVSSGAATDAYKIIPRYRLPRSSPVHEAQGTREHRVRLHDRIPRLLTYRTLVMLPPSPSKRIAPIALFGAKLPTPRVSIQREQSVRVERVK